MSAFDQLLRFRQQVPGSARGRQLPPDVPHPNDPADLFNLQDALYDEAAFRMNQEKGLEQRGYDGQSSFYAGEMGRYGRQLQASPITKQAEQVAGIQQGNLDALNEGFPGGGDAMSPMQERAIYNRKQARDKLMMPLQQTQIQANAQLGVARTQADAQRDVAKTNAETWNIRTPYANLDQLFQGGIDPSRIRGLSQSGITLTPEPQNRPVNLDPSMGRLTQLRQIMGQRGITNPWLPSNEPSRQAFMQEVSTIIARYQTGLDSQSDFNLKQEVFKALNDPSNATATVDAIMTRFGDGVTPEEAQALWSILTLVKGNQ